MERLSKHWICVCDSAVTFSVVQAARRISGVYIIGFVFRERFSKGLLAGSILSGIGFFMKHRFGTSGGDDAGDTVGSDVNYKPIATFAEDTDDEVGDREACSPTTAKSVEMCAAKIHKSLGGRESQIE